MFCFMKIVLLILHPLTFLRDLPPLLIVFKPFSPASLSSTPVSPVLRSPTLGNKSGAIWQI